MNDQDLRNILQSTPVYGDITAILAYYRYVFLVTGDFLIKMETVPELEILKTVRGYSNTTLIAGSDGQHIFVINDGKLIKLDFELEPVRLPDDAEDSGWENARLMDGSGQHLYIVENDNLIQMDAVTIQEVNRDTNWTDATLLTVPGDSYIYIFKNDELIKLKQYTLEFDDKTGDWEGTTVLTGSGRFLYLVRNNELICVLGDTLKLNPNVPVGSNKENVTLMSYFINYVYIVEEKANSFKNPEQVYLNYTDYNLHNCQPSIPRAPVYYYSSCYPCYSYYPCYPYYPYLCYFGIKFN